MGSSLSAIYLLVSVPYRQLGARARERERWQMADAIASSSLLES